MISILKHCIIPGLEDSLSKLKHQKCNSRSLQVFLHPYKGTNHFRGMLSNPYKRCMHLNPDCRKYHNLEHCKADRLLQCSPSPLRFHRCTIRFLRQSFPCLHHRLRRLRLNPQSIRCRTPLSKGCTSRASRMIVPLGTCRPLLE